MPALVFQTLGFDLGPRKLVVFRTDRNDLPHLTLSWNNSSGEIDLHFTPAHPRDKNDRDSIMKVPQTHLAEYFIALAEQFAYLVTTRVFELFFPVRGDWLRKNRYKVLQPRGESFEDWIVRVSPKLRGKYRTDIKSLRKIPKHSLRQPTTQRLIELRSMKQVWAVCTQGRDKGRVLVMHYMRWGTGVMTWVAVDYDDAPEFSVAFEQLIGEPVDTLISDTILRIRNELCLEEIGL
jgi:hypothetical protein